MSKLIELVTFVFDPLHHFWEGIKVQQKIAGSLVLVFLLAFFLSEGKRLQLLPSWLDFYFVKPNPFWAVHIAFSLLLIFEVISFIFILPCSVSKAVGKQLEILTLIFLRNCFKLLIELEEPITFSGHLDLVLKIGLYGIGGLLIYIFIAFYYKLLKRERAKDKKIKGKNIYFFVAYKKLLSCGLLFLFLLMGSYNLYALAMGKPTLLFFNEFYTILIFSDILIVLMSHRFFPEFRDIFRNSSYAVATLLMRLCLTAPVYYDVLIGVSAAFLALATSFIHYKAGEF